LTHHFREHLSEKGKIIFKRAFKIANAIFKIEGAYVLPRKSEGPLLSQHTFIYVRLDKQNRELIQQEQACC
jgi:hypothetical protein